MMTGLVKRYSSLLILFCVASCVRAADVTVVTLEGEERKGQLEEISPAGFKLSTGMANMAEIAEVRFAPLAAAPGIVLHLRNGDELRVAIVSGDDAKLKVKNPALGDLDIGNQFWRALVFVPKVSPDKAAVDEFLQAAPSQEDLILMPSGDKQNGIFETFNDKEVQFNVGNVTKPYAYDTIAAFRMAPIKEYTAPKDFRATIDLRDGSRLTGKLAALKDNKVSFEAIDGATWSVSTDAIRSIRFQGGKLAYLSDLQPKNVEEKSFVGGMPFIFSWKPDRSATGEPLNISGTSYERGLGVHSYSKLTYDLNGQYAKFLCDVGLDASVVGSSVCAWKVIVDGKEIAAGSAKPLSSPQPLKLEIANAKQLELICDYGADDDDAGDHLNWANARLIKP
jgi:hypothetical protein